MNRILALALFLMFSVSVQAQTTKSVTLGWDAVTAADLMTVHSIRIYDNPSGTSTMVAEATCTLAPPAPAVCPSQITFQATVGSKHQWTARYFDGFQEGPDSNVITTPPGLPKNLKMP